jgi:glycosyltransferase involved in cell wall biosynthesis
MPSPTLTIGLPVYNAGPFLRDCVRSIFAQSWSDWELVVVDDGSTDDGGSILRSIHDPRVRLVGPGLHRGMGAALNLITANARGRYIARMDADDMMHPSRLERQLRILLERPELDGLGCGMVVLDRRLEPIGTKLNPSDHAAICADPLSGIGIAHATFVGRAEWFRGHPYNNDSHGCEDWELLFSTFTESQFANLREPLYFYRELDSFTVSKYLRRQLRTSFFSWERGRDRFGKARTAWECGKRFARACLYASTGALRVSEFLVRKRYAPINEASAKQLRCTIQQIRSQRLPVCPETSSLQSVGSRNTGAIVEIVASKPSGRGTE